MKIKKTLGAPQNVTSTEYQCPYADYKLATILTNRLKVIYIMHKIFFIIEKYSSQVVICNNLLKYMYKQL